SSTRYSEIVVYVLTVVLSYSLYHLFANTQAGARFADKTRQALAFEQLRTQRTHIIVYAGSYFDIFETLSFVQMVLHLSPPVQDQLSPWLAVHLKQVQKREWPFRNGVTLLEPQLEVELMASSHDSLREFREVGGSNRPIRSPMAEATPVSLPEQPQIHG